MGGDGNRKLIRADVSTERMLRGQLSKPLFPDHHSVTAVCLMLVLRSEQSVRVVYDCGCRLKHECEDFFRAMERKFGSKIRSEYANVNEWRWRRECGWELLRVNGNRKLIIPADV